MGSPSTAGSTMPPGAWMPDRSRSFSVRIVTNFNVRCRVSPPCAGPLRKDFRPSLLSPMESSTCNGTKNVQRLQRQRSKRNTYSGMSMSLLSPMASSTCNSTRHMRGFQKQSRAKQDTYSSQQADYCTGIEGQILAPNIKTCWS